MRWILVLLFCLISWSADAQAIDHCSNTQTPCWTTAGRPSPAAAAMFGYNTDTDVLETFDGTNWHSINTGTVDITAFGAKCDASNFANPLLATDDAPAINAAIAAMRLVPLRGNAQTTIKLLGPVDRSCLIRSTLNMTNPGTTNTQFQSLHITVELPLLLCAVNAAPCIDAMGSMGVNWLRLNIWSQICRPADGGIPSIGIQIGRVDSDGIPPFTEQAAYHRFDRAEIRGCFTRANFYVQGSEQTVLSHSQLYNWLGQPAIIEDACNHFNAQSLALSGGGAPVPSGITQDQCVSSIDFNSVDSMFLTDNRSSAFAGVANGPDVAIWMTGFARHVFQRSYTCSACNNGTGRYPVMIWIGPQSSGGSVNTTQRDLLDFDLHMEGIGGLLGNFIMAGSATTGAVIRGFRFRDTGNNVPNGRSIFNLDTTGVEGANFNIAGGLPAGNMANIQINDLDVQISAQAGITPIPTLFDVPANWTAYGNVRLPNIAQWNEPTNFSGSLCAPEIGCVSSTPTRAVNRNPDFILDQPLEGGTTTLAAGSKTITDAWVGLAVGADLNNTLTYQRLNTLVGATSQYSFRALQTGALVTPAVGSRQSLLSIIEGQDWKVMNFGTASAQAFNFDFCAKANNTGTYSWAFANSNVSRSYVLNYGLTANTRQCFHYQIPGDTGGGVTWATTPGTSGLEIWNSLASGTNFSAAAANVWSAGFFLNTAATFNITGVAGATLEVDSVYIYPGPFRQPHFYRPYKEEFLLAQRYYQKSFNLGVAPATSAGAAGAVTIRAPYTNATFASVSTDVNFYIQMYTSTPTMTFYSTNVASANCNNATGGNVDIGAASAVNLGSTGFALSCATGGAGYAIGDLIRAHWVADSKN